MPHPSAEATHDVRRAQVVLLAVIVTVLGVWGLRAAEPVFRPFVAAFFLALLLYPIPRALVRRGVPRGIGVALAMVTLVVVVGLAITLTTFALRPVVDEAPRYAEQIQRQVSDLADWARGRGLPIPAGVPGGGGQGSSTAASDALPPGGGASAGSGGQSQGGGAEGGGIGERLQGVARTALSKMWSLTTESVLAFFFTLLMLLSAHRWEEKARAAFHEKPGQHDIADIFGAMGEKVRFWLVLRSSLGLLSAVLAGALLWALGVPFPLLWMLLIFVLNYVPNIGSIIAVIPPTLAAMADGGLGRGLMVLAGLTVIEQVVGNLIEPLVEGRQLSVSPVLALLSVIFMTWLWGPAGALMGVPLLVALTVAFAHVPSLRSLALLMSHTADYDELDRQARPRRSAPAQDDRRPATPAV